MPDDVMEPTSLDWLRELADAELVYWHAKPQVEKDRWEANTHPHERASILRTEIGAAASHIRYLQLPEEARERLRVQGFYGAEPTNDSKS